MNLFEINFTSYIPTTLLGLIGLLFAYLYGAYRSRNNTMLQQIKSVRSADRNKAIEMILNDLGVQIDTSSLDSIQKYNLLVKLLNSKTRKYLITATTSILLSVILAFLIWDNNHPNEPNKKIINNPTTIEDDTKVDSTSILENVNNKSKQSQQSNEKSKIHEVEDNPIKSQKNNNLITSEVIKELCGDYSLNYYYTRNDNSILKSLEESNGNVRIQRNNDNSINIIGDFSFKTHDLLLEKNQIYNEYYYGNFEVYKYHLKNNFDWEKIEVNGYINYITMPKNEKISDKITSISIDIKNKIIKVEEIENWYITNTPLAYAKWTKDN